MSELKAFTFGLGQYTEDGSPCVVAFDGEKNPRLASDEKFYLKSEADKVIAELEKKLDIYKRGWMENDRVNANQYAEIRHHKYKRCFAMFGKCQVRVAHCQLLERYEQRNWWRKWMFKWLELADKLKEAK